MLVRILLRWKLGSVPMADIREPISAMHLQNGSVSEVDAFRANLEVCWHMARRAADQQEKGSWLDMAESWRLLILTYQASGEEFFVRAPGRDKRRSLQDRLKLGDTTAHLRSGLLALTKVKLETPDLY
jgi:hypothetical protein